MIDMDESQQLPPGTRRSYMDDSDTTQSPESVPLPSSTLVEPSAPLQSSAQVESEDLFTDEELLEDDNQTIGVQRMNNLQNSQSTESCKNDSPSAVFRFNKPTAKLSPHGTSNTKQAPSRSVPRPTAVRRPKSSTTAKQTLVGLTPKALRELPKTVSPIAASTTRSVPASSGPPVLQKKTPDVGAPAAPSYAPLLPASVASTNNSLASTNKAGLSSSFNDSYLQMVDPGSAMGQSNVSTAEFAPELVRLGFDEEDEDEDITQVFGRAELLNQLHKPTTHAGAALSSSAASAPSVSQAPDLSSGTISRLPTPVPPAPGRSATPSPVLTQSAPAHVVSIPTPPRLATPPTVATAPSAASLTSMPAARPSDTPHPATHSVTPAQKKSPSLLTAVLLGLGAVAVIALALRLIPQPSGTLSIEVSLGDKANYAQNPKVYLDGKLACRSSPCTFEKLKPKSYQVAAVAEGFHRSIDHTVLVSHDDNATFNIELTPLLGAISLKSAVSGISATLDGQSRGELPLTIADLPNGTHELQLVGGPEFHSETRTINLKPGEALDLDVALKVKKGTATLTQGTNASGARVKVNNKWVSLPYEMEVDPEQPPAVAVTKCGFKFTGVAFDFEPGNATRSFSLNLEKSDSSPMGNARTTLAGKTRRMTTASNGSTRKNRRNGLKPKNKSRATATATSQAWSKGLTKERDASEATFNLISEPSATVTVDGQAIGLTPQRTVHVKAGKHVIVFTHPVMGRKRATTTIEAGATQTVTARFK